MKTSGFRGCCAPGVAALRSSRLFIHSLLTALNRVLASGRASVHVLFGMRLPFPSPEDLILLKVLSGRGIHVDICPNA